MRLGAGPTLLLAVVLCLAAPAQSAVLNATVLVSCDSAVCINASWPNASLPAECDACGASATKRSQPDWPSFVLFMLLLLASPFLVRLAFRYAVRAFCHVHDVPRRHPFWVEVEPEADDEAPPSPSKSVKVAPLYEETPVLRFEPATTPRDLPAPTDAWSPSTTTTTRDRPAPAAEPERAATPRDRPAPAAEPELSTTTPRDRPAPAAEPEPATTSTARQQDLAKKYAKKMIKQRYEKKFAELRRKQAAVEERLRRERASRDKCSQALDTVNDIAQEAKSGAVAPGRVSMLEMLGIGEGEAKEAADAAGGDAQKAELSLLAGLFKPKPRAEPKSPEAEAPRARTPKDRYRA